jgi:biofilm PGA synthesis N-glycosyltransferase PgaC
VIRAYIGLKRLNTGPAPTSYTPFVTVLIPFKDEDVSLKNLLRDLAKQYYPADKFELTLVNDRSTPQTLSRVKRYLSRTSVQNIRLLNNPGKGKKAALTYGVSKAKAKIVLQTDADCRLPEYWIAEMVNPFQNIEAKLVLGPVQMIPESSFWSTFAALDFLSLQAIGLGLASIRRPILGSGANMAYRKETWMEFADHQIKELSGDDTYLIQSVSKDNPSAVKLSHLSRSLVQTQAPATLKAFLNQRIRWGAKSKNYQSQGARLLAANVFLLNFVMVFLWISSFFQFLILPFFITLFITKALVDFSLMRLFARYTNQNKVFRSFGLVALLYPFYIVTTSFAILFFPSIAKWKGDKLKT